MCLRFERLKCLGRIISSITRLRVFAFSHCQDPFPDFGLIAMQGRLCPISRSPSDRKVLGLWTNENGPCFFLKCSDSFDPSPWALDHFGRCCARKRRCATSRRDNPCCCCSSGRCHQSDRYRCRRSRGRCRCGRRRRDRIHGRASLRNTASSKIRAVHSSR